MSTLSLLLSGSKSESNRALLLQALFPDMTIGNLAIADDTRIFQKALLNMSPLFDVHHAGTAMRFLTAYFATQRGVDLTLLGSERMCERPIGVLVEALRALGADITYTQNEGYPPLRIRGRALKGSQVSLRGDVSSQYASALLLIAPSLPKGLTLNLTGEITSLPYLQMTVRFLQYMLGENVAQFVDEHTIIVKPCDELLHDHWQVESDWSSASYWYSCVALSQVGTQLKLSHFKQDSLQGDSALQQLYLPLGVRTIFQGTTLVIEKVNTPTTAHYTAHLNNTPDIAQTIAVTCLGLGIGATLTGLHTLKIKETDRLQALKNEMEKLGATVTITEDSLELAAGAQLGSGVSISTYNDHRMAMAFAPLLLKTSFEIADKEVVSKSYPNFWDDFAEVMDFCK